MPVKQEKEVPRCPKKAPRPRCRSTFDNNPAIERRLTRATEMLAIYCPPFGGHLDEPLPGPAASAVLAYYLCVRAATYEILKDHPVPVDVSNPRVDVSNLRIGDPDSLRGARPQ